MMVIPLFLIAELTRYLKELYERSGDQAIMIYTQLAITGVLLTITAQAGKKIESGTDLNINDIWGDYNEKTGEWEILAVASNYGTGLEKKVLMIKDNVVLNVPTSPQMQPLLTTWFIPNRQYYVAGAGIYQKKLLEDSLWKNNATDITTFSTTSIRGNDINDIIGVGAFGDFIHYNGVNWKNDYEEPLLGYGTYGSIEIKNNLLIAVGDNYDQAIILMGVRQEEYSHTIVNSMFLYLYRKFL